MQNGAVFEGEEFDAVEPFEAEDGVKRVKLRQDGQRLAGVVYRNDEIAGIVVAAEAEIGSRQASRKLHEVGARERDEAAGIVDDVVAVAAAVSVDV